MQRFLAAILLTLTLCQPAALAAPLRVFIRAGEKSHGPGAHDHPAFPNDWTKLLNERGAQTQGALAFHTPAANKESEGHEPGKEPHIHQIAPQIWTYEGDYHRAFVCLPGHLHRKFFHNSLQTTLLRSIAWTGKRTNVDEFCEPEELDKALRHPEGGATPPKAPRKTEASSEVDLSHVVPQTIHPNNHCRSPRPPQITAPVTKPGFIAFSFTLERTA